MYTHYYYIPCVCYFLLFSLWFLYGFDICICVYIYIDIICAYSFPLIFSWYFFTFYYLKFNTVYLCFLST